jgi:16S rRNA (uracil1498-N3)-methyltransferase
VHFFFDPEFSKESTSISKAELVHFKSLRITIGEKIGVTTGKGTGFLANVVDPGSGQISDIEELPIPLDAAIHLVQSIAKGGRDETALQNATELGIASATALQAERSVSRWDHKVEKNIERWRQIAISAIKQSQQLHLPDIYYAGSVSELTPRGLGLVLDPRSVREFGEIEISGEVTLVVGPEGGFSENEIVKLEARGFVPVRFGQSILRTSSAGPAAIACVQLLSGKYGKRLD